MVKTLPFIFTFISYLFILSTCDSSNSDVNVQTGKLGDEGDIQTEIPSLDEQTLDPAYLKRELLNVFNIDIDVDKDGMASYEELKKYLENLNERNIEYNVDKQWHLYSPQIHEVFSWEGYEPERKEVLTWELYYNQTYPELAGVDVGIPLKQEQDTSKIVISTEESESGAEKIESSKASGETGDVKKSFVPSFDDNPNLKLLAKMVRRADARWRLADDNGDTLLTRDEFKFLWHPEEGNGELQSLFVKEATEDMDSNNDSKIDINEFTSHLGELASDAEKNDIHWFRSQKENFGKFLDKDKDGLLDESEMRLWLIPEKSKRFELEAKRLLDIGDKNEDMRLSQIELLENYDSYVGILPQDTWATEEDDEDRNAALGQDDVSDVEIASVGEESQHEEL